MDRNRRVLFWRETSAGPCSKYLCCPFGALMSAPMCCGKQRVAHTTLFSHPQSGLQLGPFVVSMTSLLMSEPAKQFDHCGPSKQRQESILSGCFDFHLKLMKVQILSWTFISKLHNQDSSLLLDMRYITCGILEQTRLCLFIKKETFWIYKDLNYKLSS